MIHLKNEDFRDTSHHQVINNVKYHEKLRFLNNYILIKYLILILSFTYMAFDIGIALVSPPHYVFSRKTFLMLYSVN